MPVEVNVAAGVVVFEDGAEAGDDGDLFPRQGEPDGVGPWIVGGSWLAL